MTGLARRITATGWWWLAIGAVSVLLAVLAVTALGPLAASWRLPLALSGIGMLVAGFALVGARRVDHPDGSIAMVVVAILAVGVASAGSPTMAIMQVIAYPIAWTFTPSLRAAVLANIGVAAAVAVGFSVSIGTDPDDLAQTAFTITLSLGFSLAMGFWIARMSELGDRNGVLLAELQGAQEQIAALNRDAGAAAERERLARELHDTIAQDLTGLVMLAQRARREGGTRDETLALIEEAARGALGETRALVAAGAALTGAAPGPDGGPAPELDLPGALARLADRFEREAGVHVTVDAAAAPPLDRDREVVVLRCAQEAVANARKHARASTVTIVLDEHDGCARLVVEDDGAGFDPAAASASAGFGLPGMAERLALVGGSLVVDARPGRGTRLTAEVPLDRVDA